MRTVSDFSQAPLGQDYPLGEAVISDDGAYRYVLNRRWNGYGPVMCWICLNPSTADATADDPSIRRMMGFARREGCGGICVLNLFALRATNPRQLASHRDPVGPDNDQWLRGLRADAVQVPVTVAWGANPMARRRAFRVLDLLEGVPLWCLGTTADGSPKHPLYLRLNTKLVPYGGPS